MQRSGLTTRWFLIIAFVLLQMPLPAFALPQTASIYFGPSSGTFATDSTFDVSLFLNSGEQSANAIDVTVHFPVDKLQVVSPSTGNSFVSLWLEPPSFSNKDGYIKYVGGVAGRGISSSSGLISTIKFRVKEAGSATLRIGENSTVLAGDGSGTPILKTFGRATFTLLQKPPAGSTVFSITHPDSEIWYRNNNITLGWDRPEGVADIDYSFTLDQEPSGLPDNNDDTQSTTTAFPGVADGVWYFHIKQKRNDVYGDATHYRIKIDTTAPAEFEPEIEASAGGLTRPAQVTFFTSDALSGIDHFEVGVYEGGSSEGEAPIFVEASSPYRISDIGAGTTKVVIRAFDKAGNVRDGVVEFTGGNYLLNLLKENYLGLAIAVIILGILIRHLVVRHLRSRVAQPPINVPPASPPAMPFKPL